MIEKHFDVSFVADLALHEKQIQQNYRPVIAVHKWFARRPGTLFRALLLSEFVSTPLRTAFYQAHNLQGKLVADAFMGGGTPLLEANRLGCDVVGYDINPMAQWIVQEEIQHIDLAEYQEGAARVSGELMTEVGHLYQTTCLLCASDTAQVKYFLWVKVQRCLQCGNDVDLFPGYLVAENRRHPRNVLLCAGCGALSECADRAQPGQCQRCFAHLSVSGSARKNSCLCARCGKPVRYPDESAGAPRHRMFAIEYHCGACRKSHEGRFFKTPDNRDLAKLDEAAALRRLTSSEFLPDDVIPKGDETERLHRWGYKRYAEMFNDRQSLGLERICRIVAREGRTRIRHALATNLSDLLRYQNMLCRYDTMALKSLDIFSVHGFPVGLVQCESNILGITAAKKGINVGSGGWANIVEKYARAKAYCDHPFEVRHNKGSKVRVPIHGEWIGESKNGSPAGERRRVDLRCDDAAHAEFEAGSLDAVLTDPPYFGNVQYAELMDFCYVWLRRLLREQRFFAGPSTRNPSELTGNENMKRGLSHFTEGLSQAFQRMAKALKPGAPLAFTYHHNRLEAYSPVAVAILDSGLTCSASIPCPAEMGGSIHISGTESSIIDTVFVCRLHGTTQRRLVVGDADSITAIVEKDVEDLRNGGVKVGPGDMRCIARGHLTRLAVWHLRERWNNAATISEKLAIVSRSFDKLGGLRTTEACILRRSAERAQEIDAASVSS